jgi:hypothetical protein
MDAGASKPIRIKGPSTRVRICVRIAVRFHARFLQKQNREPIFFLLSIAMVCLHISAKTQSKLTCLTPLAANRTPNRMRIRMGNRTCRQPLSRVLFTLIYSPACWPLQEKSAWKKRKGKKKESERGGEGERKRERERFERRKRSWYQYHLCRFNLQKTAFQLCYSNYNWDLKCYKKIMCSKLQKRQKL